MVAKLNYLLSFSAILVLLGLGIGTQIRKLKLIEPRFFAALFGLVLYPTLEMLASQATGIPLQELLYHPIPILMFVALAFLLGLGTRGQIQRLRQR